MKIEKSVEIDCRFVVYCTQCGAVHDIEIDISESKIDLIGRQDNIAKEFLEEGWRTIEGANMCDVCIESLKEIRHIECDDCNMWEEFPADMPRDKAQSFRVVALADDNNAIYECGCGKKDILSRIDLRR